MTSNRKLKKQELLTGDCSQCYKNLDLLDIRNSQNNVCFKCEFNNIAGKEVI